MCGDHVSIPTLFNGTVDIGLSHVSSELRRWSGYGVDICVLDVARLALSRQLLHKARTGASSRKRRQTPRTVELITIPYYYTRLDYIPKTYSYAARIPKPEMSDYTLG